MGTKNQPGKYDCYQNAEPDEPMFVLLARDPLAPWLVRIWAWSRTLMEGPSLKTDEAFRCAQWMRTWREEKRRKGDR